MAFHDGYQRKPGSQSRRGAARAGLPHRRQRSVTKMSRPRSCHRCRPCAATASRSRSSASRGPSRSASDNWANALAHACLPKDSRPRSSASAILIRGHDNPTRQEVEKFTSAILGFRRFDTASLTLGRERAVTCGCASAAPRAWSRPRPHGTFGSSEKSAIDAVKPCRKFLLPTGPSSPAQKKPAIGGSSSSEASRAAS